MCSEEPTSKALVVFQARLEPWEQTGDDHTPWPGLASPPRRPAIVLCRRLGQRAAEFVASRLWQSRQEAEE